MEFDKFIEKLKEIEEQDDCLCCKRWRDTLDKLAEEYKVSQEDNKDLEKNHELEKINNLMEKIMLKEKLEKEIWIDILKSKTK